ncbi:MAG TPA: penicillin-binding transpeptidase domain-containing protein [Myxococcota bacterium]|nr:penicillin-binding transpeptidase domain-containing protein [Myxococcota bacterium]HQK51064.1 penicillin-binding transpeptidase domain-containing protein [Myxococcota bacterium]
MIRGLDGSVEYRAHFRWALLLVLGVFLVLAVRLFHLQVLEGTRYANLAWMGHVTRDVIPAPRGAIVDREGRPLAVDMEVADLMVVPHYLKEPAEAADRLRELGVLDEEGAASLVQRVQQARQDRKTRFWKIPVVRNLQGPRCPEDLTPGVYDPKRQVLVCPVCGRSWLDQRAIVQAHLHELRGFSVQTRMVRWLPEGALTAHAVGYVNEVNAQEVEASRGALRPGDVLGRTGVEKAWDRTLRGADGEDVYLRSADGRRIDPRGLEGPFADLHSTPPEPGSDLVLTLALDLQRVAREAMAPLRSGAVVALDADTGEVLVLYSHPSRAMGRHLQLDRPRRGSSPEALAEEGFLAPQVNKALRPFPPGSTFKVFTSIAGLMEGVIGPDWKTTCYGSYLFKGRRFRCFKRSGHGETGLIRALAESCDVYFYQLGEMLGMDAIAHWARDVFGLGEPTGFDLREYPGLVPTERWYLRHRLSYQPGHALNAAVGQGDVKVTPLALARALAAVVNGGRLLRPHLVRAVRDPATGQETPIEPEVQRTIQIPDAFVDLVKRGMYDAVNGEKGTAASAALQELPFAGKTGTAQAREHRPDGPASLEGWLTQDHAWFMAYGPAQRPRLVVVVFVEHGGFGGSVAAPVARKVLEAYYASRADEFGDLWEGVAGEDLLPLQP